MQPADYADQEARVWAAHRCAEPDHAGRMTVLLVSLPTAEQALLRRILTPAYRVCAAPDAAEALSLLTKPHIGVIIAAAGTSGDWRQLWREIEALTRVPRPRLIVSADAADNCLWAEVINVGAYDVLAKPFSDDEVRWVVGDARTAWERERELGPAGHGAGRVARSGR